MNVVYRFDFAHNLVISTCEGDLNFEGAVAHQNRLRVDPAFKSTMNQLLDFGATTSYNLTSENIRHLAQATLFSGTSRRAMLVGDRDVYFGLSRMYEILRDRGPEQIKVFREYAEALEWLGLPADYPRPVKPVH